MAHFSSRLKLLSSNDGLSFGVDSRDQLRQSLYMAGGGTPLVPIRRSRLKFCARIFSSYSFPYKRKKIRDFDNTEKNLGIDEDNDDWDFDGDDDGLETDDLSCFRGLVLDISYRPVNVVCWKRAICLEYMDKADVLEYYDQTVSSPTGSFYIPAVLRVPHLLQVVKRRRVKNSLSRKNILLRDDYTCQYCSSRENLTIDHVMPVSRGGEWSWQNLVAACSRCNSKKGQKTAEEAHMKLLKVPKEPKDYDIVAIPLTNAAIRMLRSNKGMPEEWRQYLAKPLPEP
ncbi:HNH endonuclease 5 [Arabidopsis thaliana x Arabidopsis arenosa]|uniref:HNH endonuclease 5 n=1 Tax=Arabidopsis thaliana x Arabidopsis arenosa TaxID=1240361 RepID=A0A8T2BJH1_9BRAS|nr:HNH endonuclease 5 [Arabidopsis thaliana x Arabidopsis arenosa]